MNIKDINLFHGNDESFYCEYWRITKSFFNYLLENRVFTQNLLKYYSNYIRVNENFITFSNSGAVIDKLLFQLLRIGVVNKKEDRSIIHNKFSQAIIASFAGISRETVSRTVKILKEKNILEFDNCKNIHINVRLAHKFLENNKK